MKFFNFLLIFYFYFSNISYSSTIKAVDGVIDLSNWDIHKNEKISLTGQWSFFWKKLIKPEQVLNKEPLLKTHSIKVPGLWTSLAKKPEEKKNF